MADLPPDIVAHLESASFTPSPEPPAAPAPLNLPPDIIAHMASDQSLPDPTAALSDALAPKTDQKIPLDTHGVVDKYPGMGDYMDLPELKRHFRSIQAILGMANADRDSIEGIVKKNFPEVGIERQKDGSLVFQSKEGDKKKYVYRNGDFQLGDLVRAGVGGLATGGLNAAALWATGGTGLLAQLAATGLSTHLLGDIRHSAGGAAPSVLEDALASAGHGVVHGLSQIPGTALNMLEGRGAGAPGMLASAEGAAIPPGATGPGTPAVVGAGGPDALAEFSTLTRPEIPEARPVPPPVPPKYAPADTTAGLVPPETPAPLPAAQVGESPAVQGLKGQADQTLRAATPELDPSKVNSEVLGHHAGEIDRLEKISAPAYKKVDEGMKGKNARTESVINAIDKMAEPLSEGHAGLPKWVRDIYDRLTPQKGEDGATKYATYHDVDMIRKGVGDKLSSLKGPNPDYDINKAMAKRIYRALSTDQKNSIADTALRATYDTAREAKLAEHEVNSHIRTLFGLQTGDVFKGDLGPKLTSAVHGLQEGVSAPFKDLVDALPEKLKSKAIMNSISNMFGDVGAGEPPDLAKFGTWYNRTLSKSSSGELLKNLTPEARDGLQGLYGLSKQVASVTSEEGQKRFAQEAEHAAAQLAHKEAQAAYTAAVEDASKTMARVRAANEEARKIARSGIAEYKQGIRSDQAAAGREAAARATEMEAEMAAASRHVKEAKKTADAARKEAEKPGLLRRGLSLAADTFSYAGEARGVKARAAHRVLEARISAITSTPAFQKVAKAYGMPTPRAVQWVRKAIVSGLAGMPGRSGVTPMATGEPWNKPEAQ